MTETNYWIRKCGQMYICTLIDKRVCAMTLTFQAMGRTERKAVRKMNKLLKPHGYRLGAKLESPNFFQLFY